MKKTIVCFVASIAVSGLACAVPYFHTEFDEASLGDITGLNIDTPNTSGANSGTVTLDTVSQRLDMTAIGADLWGGRDGAPIAWVAAPTVAVGETWFVETQITHTDSPGGQAAGYDQAGITFYSGTPGANPGSENTGTHQSLMVGINDWNAWAHRIQGLADNNPNISAAATVGDDTFEYRVEITESGASDTYNFFYREDPADAWTQFGPTDFSQDFDNTAVGLFMKSHNNSTSASTEFDYLTIDVISDVIDTDGDGLDDELEDDLGTDPDNPDTDGDGQTDGAEVFAAGTDPTNPRSVLKITAIEHAAGGDVSLTWPSVSGKVYTLQTSADLTAWTDGPTVNASAGSETTASVETGAVAPRYYRLTATAP